MAGSSGGSGGSGGGQNGGSAQGVADDQRRGSIVLAQMIGSTNQVLDVRGKARVLEFAFRRSKSGEIKPQHSNAERG